MAKIGLTGGYTVIPEGTYIFKITDVNYKEEYGKMEVKMETATGLKHSEKFNLMAKDGGTNDGAINAFSFFAKTALNNFSLDEIDHKDLIGCFIECIVEHDIKPSTKDPNKTVTFIHLNEKRPVDGFDEEVSSPASAKKATVLEPSTRANPGSIDLDKLLG